MTPTLKSGRATFKALKTPGEFTAEFSVYGNVDLDGDRIVKDALVPALTKNPYPAVVWTHAWDIPPIGETLESKSTPTGGEGTARLFLDDHPIAKQVWAGLSAPNQPLKEFSFAFTIGAAELVENTKGEDTPRKDGRIREIQTIEEIFEWGPTLRGANPATSVLDLRKSAALGARAFKGYDDIDGWGVYCLTQMLSYGVDFIENEDDADDISVMRGILAGVMGLLSSEMAETDEGKAKIAEAFKVANEHYLARKAGARHSEEDMGLLQSIHDLTNQLGIACMAVSTGDIMGNEAGDVLASADPEQAKRAAFLRLADHPMHLVHS